MPRPAAVSNANQAVTTPSASSAGSVSTNPLGSTVSSVAPRRSATPSGFSTVRRFQVKETRSRQKDVAANIPAARVTSLARRASSNSRNHASARSCAVGVVVSGSGIPRNRHAV